MIKHHPEETREGIIKKKTNQSSHRQDTCQKNYIYYFYHISNLTNGLYVPHGTYALRSTFILHQEGPRKSQ